MSSKAAKRKMEYEKREAKRQKAKELQKAIKEAKDIETLAKAMGIPLGNEKSTS